MRGAPSASGHVTQPASTTILLGGICPACHCQIDPPPSLALTLCVRQPRFGLQPSSFTDVETANRELTLHRNKWHYLNDFEISKSKWNTSDCSSLNPDDIQAKVCWMCGVRLSSRIDEPHSITPSHLTSRAHLSSPPYLPD